MQIIKVLKHAKHQYLENIFLYSNNTEICRSSRYYIEAWKTHYLENVFSYSNNIDMQILKILKNVKHQHLENVFSYSNYMRYADPQDIKEWKTSIS